MAVIAAWVRFSAFRHPSIELVAKVLDGRELSTLRSVPRQCGQSGCGCSQRMPRNSSAVATQTNGPSSSSPRTPPRENGTKAVFAWNSAKPGVP